YTGSGGRSRSEINMRNRLLALTIVSGTAITLAGQTRRTPDGHPDLQGTYDLATLTPLERAAGSKATLTAEEAAKLESAAASQKEQGDQSIKGDRSAPPKGGDGSPGAAGNVGGYN